MQKKANQIEINQNVVGSRKIRPKVSNVNKRHEFDELRSSSALGTSKSLV